MAAQPQLLIIAGPNGAGKSTFSRDLAPKGAFVFDPDIESAKIEARFPDLPDESIHYALNQFFQDCTRNAILTRQDFVLETNFRDSGLLDAVNRFRENGYQITMVYLVLKAVRQSMERVDQRVKTGGHFINKMSIQYNYTEGLKNLNFFADRFDRLEIMDASEDLSELRTLLAIHDKQVVFLSDRIPEWIQKTIAEIANRFPDNSRDLEDDQEIERPRGPRR